MQSRPPDLGSFVHGRARSVVFARAVSVKVPQRSAVSSKVPQRSAVLLMGPTGSGKSDLAGQLAERLPLEVISLRSRLVVPRLRIRHAQPPSRTPRGMP